MTVDKLNDNRNQISLSIYRWVIPEFGVLLFAHETVNISYDTYYAAFFSERFTRISQICSVAALPHCRSPLPLPRPNSRFRWFPPADRRHVPLPTVVTTNPTHKLSPAASVFFFHSPRKSETTI